MSAWKKILIGLGLLLVLTVFGGIYMAYQFFYALAPPEIEITKNYIKTNQEFLNGVTIEKIAVDSIGPDGIPAKYTVEYWTTCNIDHPKGKPPDPPDEIYFNREGKYWWTEENVNITFIQEPFKRKLLSPNQRPLFSLSSDRIPTCPLKFENNQWYFFTIGDPQVTGIYYFVDEYGKGHQYFISSGVSPI